MSELPPHRTPNREPTGKPELDEIVAELGRCDTDLRETVTDQRVVYQGRYMSFVTEKVRLSDGHDSGRDLVFHPGAVAILALDDESRLLLVRQFRIATGGALLEIPAGTLDVEDGRVEDPGVAAGRELEEETGYRAGNLERLGGFFTAPGFSTEYITIYLATQLTPAHVERLDPDEDERLELVRLPVGVALQAVEAGVIEDAKSVAAILWLGRRLAL